MYSICYTRLNLIYLKIYARYSRDFCDQFYEDGATKARDCPEGWSGFRGPFSYGQEVQYGIIGEEKKIAGVF